MMRMDRGQYFIKLLEFCRHQSTFNCCTKAGSHGVSLIKKERIKGAVNNNKRQQQKSISDVSKNMVLHVSLIAGVLTHIITLKLNLLFCVALLIGHIGLASDESTGFHKNNSRAIAVTEKLSSYNVNELLISLRFISEKVC